RSAFGDLAKAYRDSAGLEILPGEAPLDERAAYRRELWMHQAGIANELVVRVCEYAAVASLAGALLAALSRRRRERRLAEERGDRVEPRLLKTEGRDAPIAPAPSPSPTPALDTFALQPLPAGPVAARDD